MTLKQELEALINTYAYKIAQQIFNIKEREIEELLKENKQLSNSATRCAYSSNELKGTIENDKSYRELAIKLKKERKEKELVDHNTHEFLFVIYL